MWDVEYNGGGVYYNGKKDPVEQHDKIATGVGRYFFWFHTKTAGRWRYAEACEANLFRIHSMSDGAADELVQAFIKE